MSRSLMPPAGELTEKVVIEQIDTTTTDDAGDATHTWTTYATVWAKVEDLKGGENWRAATVDPTAEVRITTHYDAGITSAMRCVIGSRELYITHVANPEARNQATVLTCKETR